MAKKTTHLRDKARIRAKERRLTAERDACTLERIGALTGFIADATTTSGFAAPYDTIAAFEARVQSLPPLVMQRYMEIARRLLTPGRAFALVVACHKSRREKAVA